MHTKQWLSNNSKVKALPLSVEGHVNTLIKVIKIFILNKLLFYNNQMINFIQKRKQLMTETWVLCISDGRHFFENLYKLFISIYVFHFFIFIFFF